MKYRKTVVGVVHQDKEFLLVQKHHWKGWWDFPQGGVDNEESLESNLLRELKEELGTDQFGNPINTYITQQRGFSPETLKHYPDRGFVGKHLHYFIVVFLGNRNDIVLGNDLSDKIWRNEMKLLDLIYHELINEAKQIIQFMKSHKLL